MPPFEVLRSFVSISPGDCDLTVRCTYEDFFRLIRRLLAAVQVDDAWYLERYPDIAEAIRRGLVASAKSHFVNNVYFEGRRPFPIHVDEHYYLTQNHDVADFVRQADLASGQEHFDENGYSEGRLPFSL